MGTFVGHILPGAGFVILGLWHLYNALVAHPSWSYKPRTWYPLPHRRLRHGELYFIALGSCLSIAAELFICPAAHQPWAADWSIPPNHLNNFEHASISLFLLVYACLAIAADGALHLPHGLIHALAAVALSQELLLFHFHSADHMGLEGHYHWLLQLPIAAAILCLLAEIFTTSPTLGLVRSTAILFQGMWFIQMGMVLWTPALLPTGCMMVDTNTVRCATDAATDHAKALVNLQFTWHLAAVVVATGAAMLFIERRRRRRGIRAYDRLGNSSRSDKFKITDDAHFHDMELQGNNSPSKSSVEMHAMVDALDLGR